MAQVVFMGFLIRFFSFSSTHLTLRDAYLFAGGISLSATFLAIVHHVYFYEVTRIGMQMRIAVGGLIYQKSLDLSSSAVHKTHVEIRKYDRHRKSSHVNN